MFHHRFCFPQKHCFSSLEKRVNNHFGCNLKYMAVSSKKIFFLISDFLSYEFSSPKFYSNNVFKFLCYNPNLKNLTPLTLNIHLFEGNKSLTFTRLISLMGSDNVLLTAIPSVAPLNSSFMPEPSP